MEELDSPKAPLSYWCWGKEDAAFDDEDKDEDEEDDDDDYIEAAGKKKNRKWKETKMEVVRKDEVIMINRDLICCVRVAVIAWYC